MGLTAANGGSMPTWVLAEERNNLITHDAIAARVNVQSSRKEILEHAVTVCI